MLVKALGIFTVSDHILRDEATTPEERQKFIYTNDGNRFRNRRITYLN